MKSRYVKFKELTKSQRIFRIVNLVLTGLMFAASVFLLFWYGLVGDPAKRFGGTIVILVASIAPLLVELIFRFRFNNGIYLIYQIYLAVAGLFGSALNGYALIPWFDTLVHCIMGYIMALLGMFVLARISKYKKLSPWLVAIFCLIFSLAVEYLWELSEWLIDRLFGSTMQGVPLEEYGIPLLWDTIKDLFCNFSGATLFFIHYILDKKTKLNLGMSAIEGEFTTRKLAPKEQLQEEEVKLDNEPQNNEKVQSESEENKTE